MSIKYNKDQWLFMETLIALGINYQSLLKRAKSEDFVARDFFNEYIVKA